MRNDQVIRVRLFELETRIPSSYAANDIWNIEAIQRAQQGSIGCAKQAGLQRIGDDNPSPWGLTRFNIESIRKPSHLPFEFRPRNAFILRLTFAERLLWFMKNRFIQKTHMSFWALIDQIAAY